MNELEIKLRAWDGRRMVYLSDLSIGLKKCKKISPYAFFATDTFGGHVSILKHKLMLFTGLTDRDGKEIYAGDVVKMDKHYGTVKYSLEAARFIISWKEEKVSRYAEFCVTFSDGEIWRCDYISVVGNIYENPELQSK